MKSKKRFLKIFLPAIAVVMAVCLGVGSWLIFGNKEDDLNIPTEQVVSSAIDTGASTADDSEKGGALYLKAGTSYTMSSGKIEGTSATYGGAVYVSNGATFTLAGGTITGCSAGYGGAIYVEQGGTVLIKKYSPTGGTTTQSSITNNTAEYGFAIYQEDGSTVTVEDDSVIQDNTYKAFLPTLDKLDLTELAKGNAKALNSNITGNVIIPETYNGVAVTNIPNQGFYNCSQITGISIPSTVTNIGNTVFWGCGKLESLNVDKDNLYFTSRNSSGTEVNAIINITTHTLIRGCKNTVIPNDGSVTILGESSFNNCSGLTNVVVPGTVTTLQNSVFAGCSDLKTAVLSSGVTSLWRQMFVNCSSLEKVYISATVTNITADLVEHSMVRYCPTTLKIYCEGSGPKTWGAYWNSINDTLKITPQYNCSLEQFYSEL